MIRGSINIVLYFLLGGILLSGMACSKGQFGDCLGGRGKTISESRGLLPFDNISVYDNISLKIVQRPGYKANISTGENVISSITTLIENNTLSIRNESRCIVLTDPWNHVEVELTIPDFDSLFISTAGHVMMADTFHVDNVWIKIEESSGDIDLTFDAFEVFVHYQTGTSDVKIYGTGHDGFFYTAAYGMLDTRDFQARHITVNNGSSNDCFVRSGVLTLDAKITSMGYIYYQGDPMNLIEVIEGPGKVIKLD
jgi:hypothetical protein